jgi:pimeloyl-ACP methyl ester carboxylesterase
MNVPSDLPGLTPAAEEARPWPLVEAELPTRRIVTRVGQHAIHALEVGEGSECVALVHGLSGSSRWWRRNLAAFGRRYRVLVPDLVGFGRTGCGGRVPSIPEAARVLCEWLDRLGVERAHMVGHSMGGQIAVHLAARYPERLQRLVLVDAAGIARPLQPRALAQFALGVAPPRRWGDPFFIPVIMRDALSTGPRRILQATMHILRDDVRPLLPSIQAPTLVVWGEWDTLVPVEHAREFRSRIPGARLVVLRRAAHNPMVDRAADFNRMVLRFLAGEEIGE